MDSVVTHEEKIQNTVPISAKCIFIHVELFLYSFNGHSNICKMTYEDSDIHYITYKAYGMSHGKA